MLYGWITDRLKKYEARGFTISNAQYVRKRLQNLLVDSCSDLYVKLEAVDSICQVMSQKWWTNLDILKMVSRRDDATTSQKGPCGTKSTTST